MDGLSVAEAAPCSSARAFTLLQRAVPGAAPPIARRGGARRAPCTREPKTPACTRLSQALLATRHNDVVEVAEAAIDEVQPAKA